MRQLSLGVLTAAALLAIFTCLCPAAAPEGPAPPLLPAQLSQADLTGPQGTLQPGIVPPAYRVAKVLWADLTGDGASDLAVGLEPSNTAPEASRRMQRPAGVVVYQGSRSGALTRLWDFPRGWSSRACEEANESATWNGVGSLEATRVTRGKLPELTFSLTFTGADFFGADSFVFGYRGEAFANLVPTGPQHLPRDARQGPGKTPLSTLGGDVSFLDRGAGKAQEIAVWSWIWGNEAKVAPHKFWGARYRWSPKKGRYQCVKVAETSLRGEAGQREILRLLGVSGDAARRG